MFLDAKPVMAAAFNSCQYLDDSLEDLPYLVVMVTH